MLERADDTVEGEVEPLLAPRQAAKAGGQVLGAYASYPFTRYTLVNALGYPVTIYLGMS